MLSKSYKSIPITPTIITYHSIMYFFAAFKILAYVSCFLFETTKYPVSI